MTSNKIWWNFVTMQSVASDTFHSSKMSGRSLLTLTDRGNVMIINAEWLDAMSKQHQRKFQELLPELVKKLIINSCTSVSSIRMPHGDDIWAPGFDGVVDCSEGNCYVPAGRSVWEFGTNENTLQKINDDYQKRTQNPLGSKIEETNFCLVTPKVWAYPQTITTWAAEHNDMTPACYATGLSKHQLFVLGYWSSFRIITPLNFLLWPMLGICLPRKHCLQCPIRYFSPIVNKKWRVSLIQ